MTLNEIEKLWIENEKTRGNLRDLVSTVTNSLSVSFVGRGNNRVVFVDESFAYKVPVSSTGLRHNAKAISIYESEDSPDLLAHVYPESDSILKQVKVSVDDSARSQIEEKLREVNYVYTDWDKDSVGFLFDGTAVIVDIPGLERR